MPRSQRGGYQKDGDEESQRTQRGFLKGVASVFFSILVRCIFLKVEVAERVVQLRCCHGGSAFGRLSPPLGLSSDNESAFAFAFVPMKLPKLSLRKSPSNWYEGS